MEMGGILLVDDDTVILSLLMNCFRQIGVGVDCAQNGADALKLLRENRYSLMLTDLQMPGMDGLELARNARELAPDLHIVMCTGFVTPELCAMADKTGIAQVLRKPFHFVELLAIAKGAVKPKQADAPADACMFGKK